MEIGVYAINILPYLQTFQLSYLTAPLLDSELNQLMILKVTYSFIYKVFLFYVLTRVTIGEYAAGLIRNQNYTNFTQNLLNGLYNALTTLTYSANSSFYQFV